MTAELELSALELVNEIISNGKLPIERAKSLTLNWEYVSGYYLPRLEFSFYKTVEEKENADIESL
jgi:hypothetical protein